MISVTLDRALETDAVQPFNNVRPLTWTGPLVLVMARPVLFLCLQAALATIFALQHRPSAWRSAGAWWSVYGTLVDIFCLVMMARFTKAERIGIRDLIGKVHLRWGCDIFVGLGLFLLVFPVFMGGSFVSSLLVYGSWDPQRNLYLLGVRSLPLWGVVYSWPFGGSSLPRRKKLRIKRTRCLEFERYPVAHG